MDKVQICPKFRGILKKHFGQVFSFYLQKTNFKMEPTFMQFEHECCNIQTACIIFISSIEGFQYYSIG